MGVRGASPLKMGLHLVQLTTPTTPYYPSTTPRIVYRRYLLLTVPLPPPTTPTTPTTPYVQYLYYPCYLLLLLLPLLPLLPQREAQHVSCTTMYSVCIVLVLCMVLRCISASMYWGMDRLFLE